ncbi:MAG TPA: response regulator [Sulfuricella sp.]|nr:response regulator [Sulfuricella sp.]
MTPNSNSPIAMTDVPTLHILLVEDNQVNQELMIALLKRRRHRVVVAQNGKEALDILERHEFDAILMDIQMPVMDGLEATRQIREKEKQSGGHVPIIAITANTLPQDQELCVQAGMDDYVAKPVEINKLFTALQRIPAK